ncbi:sodium-dependent glucose transporter 1-like [Actinia tenebrosa]|uniref:Sodium-dependent glucose transporter 1-like n=1 Tax=Actinia tenebrosa TaxID=6105 RepID=A0A6P8H406_ACTTE|nr:sodium-dependent glucose transporter 1-like [Actinia tenebrosa]
MAAEPLVKQDELAEVLREWGDEEDEVVEPVQHSRPDSRGTRQRNENGSPLQDVDNPSDINGTKPPGERSSLTGKPFYAPYVRFFKAASLFLSFLGMGISNTLYGTAILDLAFHASTKLPYMSFVFTARSIGYLVGSIAGGWTYDKYDRYLVLGCSCLGCALATTVFPLVGSLYAFISIASAMTICTSFLNTAGNAICFVLWPENFQPYLQFLHFTFALGSCLAPLLSQPFLLPDALTNPPLNHTDNRNATGGYDPGDILPITWAYWISSVPLIASGLFFLACAFLKGLKETVVKKEEHHSTVNHPNSLLFKAIVLFLFFILLLQYGGIEVAYGGYVFMYAVKTKPHMSKHMASLLTATYWGTFALGRLISVQLAKYIKPPKMILADFIGCLLAGVILISQTQYGCDANSGPKLWAGTIILGISAASLFPSALSWAEYFVEISGRVASLLLVGACLGEMTIPIAVGNTFDTIGPCSLMYCIFALSFLGILNFAAILLFGRHYRSLSVFSGVEFHKNDVIEKPPKPKQQDEDEVLRLLEENNELFNGNY